MKPSWRLILPVAALALASNPAAADRVLDTPAAGGGDAGPHLSVGLLPGRLEVSLLGPGQRPLPATHASGTAVLTVNGKLLGVALVPAGGNRLVGQAPFQTGDDVAVEIHVTLNGQSLTARYGAL